MIIDPNSIIAKAFIGCDRKVFIEAEETISISNVVIAAGTKVAKDSSLFPAKYLLLDPSIVRLGNTAVLGAHRELVLTCKVSLQENPSH